MLTVLRLFGGRNLFVGLKANISCLDGKGCWSSTKIKDDEADADLCGCRSLDVIVDCLGAAMCVGCTAGVETCCASGIISMY